jgi:ribosomal protein L17
MGSFLDRARDWRRRAEELRRIAERMVTQAARTSLLDRAAALDHHAENIEQVTAKFRDIHETAAMGNAFRDFVPRRSGRRGQDDG